MTVRVDWVRHGQGVVNVTQTFSHRLVDGDLTDLGRAQAHALGASLIARGWPRPALLVSSPLSRARQTAQILAGHLGVPYSGEVEAFRELDVGELDGRSDPASWEVFDAVVQRWAAGEAAVRFPGGESLADVVDRMQAGLAYVAHACPGPAAMVVAHGGTLLFALTALTGQEHGRSDFANCEIARLEVATSPPLPVRVRLLGFEHPPQPAAR